MNVGMAMAKRPMEAMISLGPLTNGKTTPVTAKKIAVASRPYEMKLIAFCTVFQIAANKGSSYF